MSKSVVPHKTADVIIEEDRPLTEQELAMLEQAEADILAGKSVEWRLVKAWLCELDSDPGAPMPKPGCGAQGTET